MADTELSVLQDIRDLMEQLLAAVMMTGYDADKLKKMKELKKEFEKTP